MPFSFFAARCMYVARQPLHYRRDVIRRIYIGRLTGHLALFSSVKAPEILTSGMALLG
tara:strand:- start:565 stop:738 length:174 start_codon:yes stop_codon:yes gene_type:complete